MNKNKEINNNSYDKLNNLLYLNNKISSMNKTNDSNVNNIKLFKTVSYNQSRNKLNNLNICNSKEQKTKNEYLFSANSTITNVNENNKLCVNNKNKALKSTNYIPINSIISLTEGEENSNYKSLVNAKNKNNDTFNSNNCLFDGNNCFKNNELLNSIISANSLVKNKDIISDNIYILINDLQQQNISLNEKCIKLENELIAKTKIIEDYEFYNYSILEKLKEKAILCNNNNASNNDLYSKKVNIKSINYTSTEYSNFVGRLNEIRNSIKNSFEYIDNNVSNLFNINKELCNNNKVRILYNYNYQKVYK